MLLGFTSDLSLSVLFSQKTLNYLPMGDFQDHKVYNYITCNINELVLFQIISIHCFYK